MAIEPPVAQAPDAAPPADATPVTPPTPEPQATETAGEETELLPPPTASPKELAEMRANLRKQAETPETPAPEKPASEVEKPAEEATPPETPKEPKTLPNRISTSQFDPTEQEAIALRHRMKLAGEDVPSLKEAIEIVEARQAKTPKAAEAPEPETDLAPLEAKLAELKSKRAETLKALGLDDVLAIEQEMESAKAELSEVQAKARAKQQSEAESIQEARVTARDSAIELFPDAASQDTALGQEINALVAEMRSPKHRDHGVLNTQNAPMFVAQAAAQRLAQRQAAETGVSFAQAFASLMAQPAAAKPAPASPKPAAVAAPKITPAGGAPTTPLPATTAPKVLDLSSPDSMDPKAIAEYFAKRRGASSGGGLILRR